MTEPQGLEPAAVPVDPDLMARRYGTRRPSMLLLASIVIVAVLFVGWVIWAALQQANKPIVWRTVGFSGLSDTSITIDFDVTKPADESVVCTVHALDASGVEVGRAQVPVTTRESDAQLSYTLQVTGRPGSAEVIDCQPTQGE